MSKKQTAVEAGVNSTLNDVLKIVTEQRSTIDQLNNNYNTLSDILNNVIERVEDISKKLDIMLNIESVNINPTQTTEVAPEKACKKNIMAYFKDAYVKNQNAFDNVFEENQIQSILAESATKMKTQPGSVDRLKEESTILYKKLTKEQKKIIAVSRTTMSNTINVSESEINLD